MQAEAGAELACRAHEHDFSYKGQLVRRGIVSYFATETLSQATSMNAWLAAINQQSEQAVTGGLLPKFRQPMLRVVGNGDRKIGW